MRRTLLGTCRAKPSARMGVPFISSHARRRDQVVAVDLGVRSTKAVHVQRVIDETERVTAPLHMHGLRAAHAEIDCGLRA